MKRDEISLRVGTVPEKKSDSWADGLVIAEGICQIIVCILELLSL